ncbi:MAG: ABC transporter permease [Desulfuromonas thiophila]|nr:ABC transporter permease [Desulfuromonas thiophila]
MTEARLRLQQQDRHLRLCLSGDWHRGSPLPDLAAVASALQHENIAALELDGSALGRWDSLLLLFIRQLQQLADKTQRPLELTALPAGAQQLLELMTAVPPARFPARPRPSLPERVGAQARRQLSAVAASLAFIGAASLAFGRFARGRARFRAEDLRDQLYCSGAQALPIITLVAVLIGLILAFVGAVQLKLFGAEIYVADLVAIGMTREMGAMMAAIIMAGRTGAAFAAQIGTMQVNEEIDALRTLGIDPMEFLVLPRMLALILMLPLLCLYADLLGMAGGLLVAGGLLDLPLNQYLHQTLAALSLNHFLLGLGKSVVFGVIVALAGCLRGLQCGRSAAAVGDAATSAVVSAIVAIIVCDGLFAVLADLFGV